MAPSRSNRRARTTELEQVGIEAILERGREAVPGAFVDLQRRLLDDLRGQERRRADRHDLIVVAVDDQRRDVDLLRSSVRSVSEKTLMQSYTPLKPACMPSSQNVSRTPCDTVAPARLAPKNGALKSLKN